MDFETYFRHATGFRRYQWQADLALNGFDAVLPIPTGLGKTEGAVLAWAWRRLREMDEPLHLVYCLPMRALVRQTVGRLNRCFEAVASATNVEPTPVYQLMAGAVQDEWVRWPDRSWVLVGTQDQLLSRALNRGYAMSRFDWPINFGLLNQDCRWIIDEVQLMGAGLWTSAQLDWMRQRRFKSLRDCKTTWMSATVGMDFLATVDRKKDGLHKARVFESRLDQDPNPELQTRLKAKRTVEWFGGAKGERAKPLHEQIAFRAEREHTPGTLSLVVCNTVRAAQAIFKEFDDDAPRILLTSRFRPMDRISGERRLTEFEFRRSRSGDGCVGNHPGLICVSTQVVEAGLDISAHRLWTELAPWPSMLQRLGRLNRDGRDSDARAYVFRTPKVEERKRDGETWVGPYRKNQLAETSKIVEALIQPSTGLPFTKALESITAEHSGLLNRLLQPELTRLPRAFDVHGLFSTERDVHGGFTDVSEFVRGGDPDADATVFWRDWAGDRPPCDDELDGPAFDPEEGCPVAFYRIKDLLEKSHANGWIWDEEDEEWRPIRPDAIRAGMVLMLRRDVGGYDCTLGWTGEHSDTLDKVPRAGRERALRFDERTETGYWSRLSIHLSDARKEAEKICDGLGLTSQDSASHSIRKAVVEGAGLHDLGKAHRKWQSALPAGGVMTSGPWAKCPRVLAIDTRSNHVTIANEVRRIRPGALSLPRRERRGQIVRLRWAVGEKLTREELEALKNMPDVIWAGHEPLRSGLRHEAASALAMWNRYREGTAAFPALAVYLAAAHHGKVRTVLRSTVPDGEDVFGVEVDTPPLEVDSERWPLDFSVAADGAAGVWRDGEFVMTGHGWTGLVADLLGPWRGEEDQSEVGAVPQTEPRRLGPFVLAWLEALVRIADWRASDAPSLCTKPDEVTR